MGQIKKIALVVVLVVVIILIIGLLLPSKAVIERKITINASVEVIFKYINNLQENAKWDPWYKTDKTMKIIYGSKTEGVGATYSWTSEDSGSGTLTITESEMGKSIKTLLDFKEQGLGSGYWTFAAGENGVDVTQGFISDTGGDIMVKYFSLLLDSVVGPKFEEGLNNLKKLAEGKK